MLSHPEREVLDACLEGLATGAAGVVLHLLRCDRCAAEALERLAPVGQRLGPLALGRQAPGIDYSALWQRIEESHREAVEVLRRERAEAGPLLRELLAVPAGERLERIGSAARLRSRALAERLVDEARRQPPREREELARLALAIAGKLPDSPDQPAADLRAAAGCQLGEALRLQGDLPGAEAAFVAAAASLEGSADLQERAVYCHLLAALRGDQGRLDEALALLARAADLLEEQGNLHARATVLVEAGFLALEGGEARRALAAFDDAAASGRFLWAGHAFRATAGTAMALALEGRFDEAAGFLAQAQETYGWTPESAEGLRVGALQGRIALSAGRLDPARALLTVSFHGLLQLGDVREAVRAALGLARAHLRQGRARRPLRDLGLQLQPLLVSPRLPESFRVALAGFVQAATGGGPVTLRWLAELEQLLDRVREPAG